VPGVEHERRIGAAAALDDRERGGRVGDPRPRQILERDEQTVLARAVAYAASASAARSTSMLAPNPCATLSERPPMPSAIA
jgi:hypothetical protein